MIEVTLMIVVILKEEILVGSRNTVTVVFMMHMVSKEVSVSFPLDMVGETIVFISKVVSYCNVVEKTFDQ